MVKLVFCLQRLNGLSRDEFQLYWRGTHGSLVRRYAPVLAIRRYVQVVSLDAPLMSMAMKKSPLVAR